MFHQFPAKINFTLFPLTSHSLSVSPPWFICPSRRVRSRRCQTHEWFTAEKFFACRLMLCQQCTYVKAVACHSCLRQCQKNIAKNIDKKLFFIQPCFCRKLSIILLSVEISWNSWRKLQRIRSINSNRFHELFHKLNEFATLIKVTKALITVIAWVSVNKLRHFGV